MKKATAATKGLYTRGNIYYVRKVIPAHLREIAGKREFLVSLKTDNYQTAILKYSDVKENIDYAISAMKDGTYQKEVLDFDHYSKIAAANGRQLQCLKEILPDPTKVSALVQQIKAADKNKELSKHEIKSYINVKNSDIKLSKLPEIYIEAKKLELKDYNDRERARKIDPLKNACKQLQTFLKKDKLLKDITKADARHFHRHLRQRIFEKTISANTANKYLTHLRVLISTYYHEHDLDNENVFAGLRFSENRGKRSPLTADFIAQRWLRNPIFDQASPTLKYMLWAMIDTGCSFKELCGLDPETDIQLSSDIPFIEIKANANRKLKTNFRSRKIPLIGLSLKAFKRFPRGFEQYNTDNGPTNASAALNKFLKKHDLFQNDRQTAYSTRHCFKDRLRHHNIHAEMQDYLMGHKSPGMGSHYGNGYNLEQMHKALLLLENDFK